MKKLLFALAVVCAATMVNASTFNWSAANAYVVKPGGGPTDGITGTAYLFATTGDNAYMQSALVAALQGGSSIASVVNDHSVGADALAITGGKSAAGVSSDSFDYNQGAQTFYALFVDSSASDRVYISSTAGATGQEIESQVAQIALANQASTSTAAVKTGAYDGAGWYSIPEPTSGMLLLLGFCGLALRRKLKQA